MGKWDVVMRVGDLIDLLVQQEPGARTAIPAGVGLTAEYVGWEVRPERDYAEDVLVLMPKVSGIIIPMLRPTPARLGPRPGPGLTRGRG